MKKLIVSVCSVFLLSSCQEELVQIFTTKSTNTQLENDYYVYENETLKITYQFWHDKGLMSFAVFNKLDAPIYIDWSKSCIINNSSKVNYWFSGPPTATYYNHHYYTGPIEAPGYNINEDIGVSNSAKNQLFEKVSFIPAKSTYYRSQFHFWPEDFLDINQTQVEEVNCNEDPSKTTKVYYANFDRSNSPLVVRNYLAVCKSDKLDDVIYIDNEFYVTSVKEMYIGHALGKHVMKNKLGEHVFEQPFKNKTSFYVLHYDILKVEGMKRDRK